MALTQELIDALGERNVHLWGGPDTAVDISGKQWSFVRLENRYPRRVKVYPEDRQVGADVDGQWFLTDWPANASDAEVAAFIAGWQPARFASR